ncbi:RdgB/HAM1 family non-canonical purine NTP pyrophosphatase [Gorillibacterium timonense]|uniref:RdgB/HAM1 family non-canonical purine NTP pyrophosphatase n=1 Tax=Gorillibacterium timonense TaxID=1689269 RepID=UPI000A67A4C2|nr:RdgB/HAM1 family non-canonical purine NTP pyrophosphatase [Gorillibacterium timonense]
MLEHPKVAGGDHPQKIILVATRNKGKVGEFTALFGELGYTVRSLLDYEELPDVVEDQDTFLGNALKKAREIAERLRISVLADDSGLEVDALDGEPGVYSARYAGEPCDDGANNDKLLRELAKRADATPLDVENTPHTSVSVYSQARFVSVLVLYDPANGTWIHAEGTCSGYILAERRGEGGFGYDPLFYMPEFGKTLAEMTMAEKNRVSHRANALAKLIGQLKEN